MSADFPATAHGEPNIDARIGGAIEEGHFSASAMGPLSQIFRIYDPVPPLTVEEVRAALVTRKLLDQRPSAQ